MTTKEIREVVKAYKNGEIDDNGDWVAEGGENEDENEGDKMDDKTEKLIATIGKNLDKLMKVDKLDEETVKRLEEIRAFISEIKL